MSIRSGLAAWFLVVSSFSGLCQSMPSGDDAQEPTLRFAIEGAVQQAVEETALEVTVVDRSAHIRGIIPTPNPCYDIAAQLEESDETLRIILTATPRPEICAQVITRYRYTATLEGLTPGRHPVTVIHEYPETGWERKTHLLQIRIP